jgi:Ca-activated chloride channel family protein
VTRTSDLETAVRGGAGARRAGRTGRVRRAAALLGVCCGSLALGWSMAPRTARATAQALPGARATQTAASPASSEGWVRTPTLYVEVRGADGGPVEVAPGASSPVEVLEQGQPRGIVELAPLPAAAWSIVIYADLPLSSPAGLAAAADALDSAADHLVALGEVDVVVGATAARSLVEGDAPSRDAPSVRAALDELRERSHQAGELLRRRERLREDAADAEGSAELRRLLTDHRYEEMELRNWQQSVLEDWLLGVAEDVLPPIAARPRALILLRDAADASPDGFLAELAGEDAAVSTPAAQSLAETYRQREFARAAATLGWVVLPVRLGSAAGAASSGAATEPDTELADATGGVVVREASALSSELVALASRIRVRYETTSLTGDPSPVDVRAAAGASGARARGPRWVSGLAPEMLALVRARRLLEDGIGGELEVAAGVLGDQTGSAVLEAAVPLSELGSASSALRSDRLRVTVVRMRLDHDPEAERFRGVGLELRGDHWILQTPIETPEDLQDVVVVAEDLATGTWGAAFAEPSDTSLVAPGAAAVVEIPGITSPPSATPPAAPAVSVDDAARTRVATQSDARPAPDTTVDDDAPGVPGTAPDASHALPGAARPRTPLTRFPALQLVPPRGRELTGPHEFTTLLSMESIRRVEFFVDGELQADDTRRPFSARLDLGPQVKEHEVRAVAYSRDGVALGEDVVQVNAARLTTGIRVSEANPLPGGDQVEVVAELQLPPDVRLDRVELYRNETLGATLTRPPFRATLPGPARADADYVRAVAYLGDGTQLEDVRLLGSSAALSERVEVNLVEVYAVVTDQQGDVIQGLQASDFELKIGRDAVAIDRLAVADEVPLVVGLAIDTSSSMWTLMPDTRNAAARFLGRVLRADDRGFVVEFSDRPRLAHGESADPIALMRSIGKLQAGGATALYDSVMFSLLQFEPGLGRKAVVLLTDGDDYNSRFSYRRTHRTAAQAGVPCYFVVLAGGGGDERPVFRKDDLELIADVSGGRVFYVSGEEDVNDAYARIGQELRSQYVVAFTSPEPLDDDELERVKLTVKGPKRQVRFAVGRQ